ncbi:MAG: RNA methyltransferase [Thermoplasmataceae archaeon]
MSRRIQSKSELKEKKENFLQNFSTVLQQISKTVCVVLVEPEIQGNIGAVARLLRNAGLHDLRIVNGPEIGDEALARSMGGKEILISAGKFNTFSESVADCTVVAATSSEQTLSDRKFRRLPVTPWEFWETHPPGNEKIALVFGREADGLRNTEIEICNAFIHIPGNPEYPVYNLSHAVSIVLYEMLRHLPESNPDIPDPATGDEMELINQKIQEIMEKYGYPDYKMQNSLIMIRRILARSAITESEFYKLMGILRFVLAPWEEENEKER